MKKYAMASLALSLLVQTAGMAQTNGTNSPYSRYGFGMITDPSQGFNKGMSGVALGMQSPAQLNFLNPASYAAIDSMTFLADAGISFQNLNIKSGNAQTNIKNSSFDYLNAGFRLRKNVGFSVGFMPFSAVGYNLTTSSVQLSTSDYEQLTTTTAYTGEGGLRQAYAGIGWKPFRRFSVGVNLAYLWGDYTHSTRETFSDAAVQPVYRTYSADINTYKADFGVQYEYVLNRNNSVTLGATYGLGHNVGSKALFINQKISGGVIASADTIALPRAFQLPHTFGVGLAWKHKDNLTVGADYTCQLWGETRFPTLTSENNSISYVSTTGALSNRHKIAVGGEYIPDNNSLRYAGHIRYRAGVSYATPYARIQGVEGAGTYGVSAGIGLPILNQYKTRSVLNISAGWDHTGGGRNGLVTENYFRLSVGLSFNEEWFQKWKVK